MCVACEDADRCFIMQIVESCDGLSVISLTVVVVVVAAAAITSIFLFSSVFLFHGSSRFHCSR